MAFSIVLAASLTLRSILGFFFISVAKCFESCAFSIIVLSKANFGYLLLFKTSIQAFILTKFRAVLSSKFHIKFLSSSNSSPRFLIARIISKTNFVHIKKFPRSSESSVFILFFLFFFVLFEEKIASSTSSSLPLPSTDC